MASTATNSVILSVLATAALTANRCVSIAGAVPAGAATSLGVSMSDGAIGDFVPVVVLGTAVAIAGAAIAKGAAVEVGTTGKVVTKSAGITIGRALAAAAADGDQVEILLIGN